MSGVIAIASSYGEGASGKAVSTYFERVKKDNQWNLTNTIAENASNAGSAIKKTPRKKTPAKRKGGAQASDGDSADEEETPSKKSAMNKVASGRVTKARSATKKGKYAEPESDVEDQDDQEEMGSRGVKKEEMGGFADAPGHQAGSFNNGFSGETGYNGGGSQYAVQANGGNGYGAHDSYYDEDVVEEA